MPEGRAAHAQPGTPRLLVQGETAFTVEFGDTIDLALTAAVLALDAALRDADLPGLRETVPSYRSLTGHLDPVAVEPEDLARRVLALARAAPAMAPAGRTWRIPVVYGGDYGVDLGDVARTHGLAPDELVARHAAPTYRVAMLGFLPGYAYLSGLDAGLALSRRPAPRPSTPAGTISIGGAQALVASIAAPSGWHLLGRTPVRTFLPGRDPVFLLEPGDRVRFVPTAPARWHDLDRAAAAGAAVAELA